MLPHNSVQGLHYCAIGKARTLASILLVLLVLGRDCLKLFSPWVVSVVRHLNECRVFASCKLPRIRVWVAWYALQSQLLLVAAVAGFMFAKQLALGLCHNRKFSYSMSQYIDQVNPTAKLWQNVGYIKFCPFMRFSTRLCKVGVWHIL